MKNEPVVTYNHMEEDSSLSGFQNANAMENKKNHPISLYMILVVDFLLMGAIAFFAFKVIF